MSRVELRRPSDVDELAGGGGDDPTRRRWPVWALTLVLATTGVAVNRPELPLYADRPVPQPSAVEAHRSARLGGVAWPARGDLVEDRGFLVAARDRIRAEHAGVARVYFAGRFSDGSRLMLAGTDGANGAFATSVHALHVPAGVPIRAALVSEEPALVDPRQVLAWAARGADGRVRAVALTRPGHVRFELSARVDVRPVDGPPIRHWVSATATDGVIVADLGGDADPIVTVRAFGARVFTQPLLVRVASRPPTAAARPKVQS